MDDTHFRESDVDGLLHHLNNNILPQHIIIIYLGTKGGWIFLFLHINITSKADSKLGITV